MLVQLFSLRRILLCRDRGKWCLAILLTMFIAVALAWSAPFASLAGQRSPSGRGAEEWRATLIPGQKCQLTSRFASVVQKYLVREGDKFPVGKPLLLLDSREAELSLARARAAEDEALAIHVQAKGELDSLKDLFSREATTLRELRRAEAQINIAQARLQEAQAALQQAKLDLDSCRVVAPIPGCLVTRRKLPGEGTRVGGVLCDLIDTSSLYAVIQVPVERLKLFVKGKPARFIGRDQRVHDGRIEQIGVLVDPGSRSVRVKILLDNQEGRLWAGSSGTVSLEGK